MIKFEKLRKLPKCDQTHKVSNATGKIEQINLVEVRLTQTLNLFKKKKYL